MHRLLFLLTMIALNSYAADDEDLATERWFVSETDNFVIYSQLSKTQTERRAGALENWRTAAQQLLGEAYSQSPIKTYFYLFDDVDDYALFAQSEDVAYFFSSPRANFIIAQSSDAGIDMAQHHYAHFLINNRPIGVPRWFEEGMSQYLSRLELDGRKVELQGFDKENYDLIAALNSELSLDDLLYDDASLASPRIIQIANLKAAMFVQFLLHAHQREGFEDRSGDLQNYLDFLQQGRTERFAYDQAFNLSVRRMTDEFNRFVEEGQRRGDRNGELFQIELEKKFDAHEAASDEIRLALAEISLHSGRFPLAAYFFESLTQNGEGGGRAYSGLADSQRMYAEEAHEDSFTAMTSPELELLYQQALEVGPQDYQLQLDFGQYYDSLRADCEKPLSPTELQFAQQAMATHFENALAMNPESAEVNLSVGQLYLFEGKDWQQGLVYQDRAFATLPADNFVLEQAIKYAILATDYSRAEALINRMARPMHFWGVPTWISNLQAELRAAQRGEEYEPCAGALE